MIILLFLAKNVSCCGGQLPRSLQSICGFPRFPPLSLLRNSLMTLTIGRTGSGGSGNLYILSCRDSDLLPFPGRLELPAISFILFHVCAFHLLVSCVFCFFLTYLFFYTYYAALTVVLGWDFPFFLYFLLSVLFCPVLIYVPISLKKTIKRIKKNKF